MYFIHVQHVIFFSTQTNLMDGQELVEEKRILVLYINYVSNTVLSLKIKTNRIYSLFK